MEKWTICNKKGDFAGIRQRFGVSEIMARLLVNRDITDPEEIRHYLRPTLSDLHSPHLMKNLDGAVKLTADKIKDHKKIRVVGDYDVDGIMATYILNDALKRCGADTDWYIPHRIRDGYGLNEDIIRSAGEDGIDTVITCDNGISAVAASKEAERLGITLIITDHHELPSQLPVAAYIVDPKQEDETYPCREICGAVVAAKFAKALLELVKVKTEPVDYLEYMAMATICDVVSLKGENRIIARLGMETLKHTQNFGISALMRETGIEPEMLSEYHIGFVLGPCFNATGRIDDAGLAFELLSADTDFDAERLALECKNLNEDRKRITSRQEQLAYEILDKAGDALPRVIVLDLPDCHESILGIIAGRIKEKYNRPAIVITKSGENYKGSARSIPAYNMFEELCGCSEYLLKFGGHPMAAGLTVYDGQVEAFTEAINRRCTLSPDDMCRKIQIDAEISFNLFTEEVIEEINNLAPFGPANQSPLFAERNLKVKSIRYIGKDNSFLKFRLQNGYGHEFTATSFADAGNVIEQLSQRFGRAQVDRALNGGENSILITAAYLPRMNEYRDIKEMQMNIKALRF